LPEVWVFFFAPRSDLSSEKEKYHYAGLHMKYPPISNRYDLSEATRAEMPSSPLLNGLNCLNRLNRSSHGRLCVLLLSLIISLGILSNPNRALGFDAADLAQVGLAFITNLAIHESGHYVMASSLGADGNRLNFFTQRKGSFFLGLSTYSTMDEEGKLPYNLAGEIAVSHTFEYSLYRYRNYPTTYNQALLFFSGSDFFWYSLYAFYISQNQDDHFDPVSIAEETGLGKGVIFSVALSQALLNSYRAISGEDRIVPYFTFDHEFASFNVKFNF
jgi:hypothetical protein